MQICICMVSVEYKKLGDIATYINGYAFKPEQRGSEGLPIIRIQDLTGNAYDLGYYNGDYPKKVELNDGDVLISWSASLGVYLWNRGKALLNQHIFKVVFDKVEIDKFYFMYAVEYNLDKMSLKTHGATMKHITKKDFDNVVIPYPDLDYQKEISYRLTSLKGIIKKYQEQLVLLDELIKARFVEMFGDPNIEFKYSSVKFNDLVVRMTKGPFGSDMKKDLFVPKGENTYKVYIQINAIQKNQSLGEYYISKEYFDRKVSRFELFPNDYIITCDGTLGKYLKLDENMEKGVISPSLLRLTLQNDKINDKYFENIWDFYMLGLMKKEARNACLVHLPSAKKIGEISIPVPPLELQNQFASFVEEIDKSRLLSNHSLFLIKSITF